MCVHVLKKKSAQNKCNFSNVVTFTLDALKIKEGSSPQMWSISLRYFNSQFRCFLSLTLKYIMIETRQWFHQNKITNSVYLNAVIKFISN